MTSVLFLNTSTFWDFFMHILIKLYRFLTSQPLSFLSVIQMLFTVSKSLGIKYWWGALFISLTLIRVDLAFVPANIQPKPCIILCVFRPDHEKFAGSLNLTLRLKPSTQPHRGGPFSPFKRRIQRDPAEDQNPFF